jgi:hypothetical protein
LKNASGVDGIPNATDRKEGYVLRKLQPGLTSVGSWCEHWNIRINEDKTQTIYFSRGNRPPETSLTLNGRNIPFVNSIKYLGVIFDRKITWRIHIEAIDVKAFRTFLRVCSLFKSERLDANIKQTLHKALIRSGNSGKSGNSFRDTKDNYTQLLVKTYRSTGF